MSFAASGWQGPLRAAVAILAIGFLVVWLVGPVGDPCPDLRRLPQGSTASSSPSFAPPGTRTCTYTTSAASGAIQARSRYVPWLDWMLVVLVAALAAGAVRLASPVARRERAQRVDR